MAQHKPVGAGPRRQLNGAQRGSESMWRTAARRFGRNTRAFVALVVLLLLTLSAIAAPKLTHYDRDKPDLFHAEQAPSRDHWLGTDDLGRDVYTRLLYGGRVSLSVGLVVVGIELVIGVLLGAVAGFYGGLADSAIMRITDIFLIIPFYPLALTMAAILKPSVYNTMIILGALGWTTVCRLVRGEFLTLRKRDFVEAATAEGAQDGRIIFRHILPNALAPIIVTATLGVGGAILAESGLSFLGLGVQQPIPSWGNMLSSAINLRVLVMQPWLWIPPGLVIFVAVLCVNLVGDGLRDALDPRLKE